jgi:hypothetical protein
METNRVPEAESSSNSTRRRYPSGDYDGANKAMVTTDSGYDKQLISPISEESPLLSNGSENGRNSAPSGNEGESDAEWHGAKDFEGLPWWRRPSVRTNWMQYRKHWLTGLY